MNPLLAALAAADAQAPLPPAQDSVPEIVWRLLSTSQGTPGTPGSLGDTLSGYVHGILASAATVGTYFVYTTSPDFGLPTRRNWSWNEMNMEHTQIFELTRLSTFQEPRIGARWVTGLVSGRPLNTPNENLIDQAGASLEINLAPPTHLYTFPHTEMANGLTRVLIVNKVAWADAIGTRTGLAVTTTLPPDPKQSRNTDDIGDGRRSRERAGAGAGAGPEHTGTGEEHTVLKWDDRKSKEIHDWSFTNDDGVVIKVDSKDNVKEKAATTRAVVRAMGKDKRRVVFSNLVLGMDKL